MTQYLIFGFTFAFAAVVQPGPFQAYLISQSLALGWRRTLIAAFSPLISDGPIIVLVLLVLSQVSPVFVQGLQIGGGVFLFFLAIKAFQTYRNNRTTPITAKQSNHQTLLRAALVNLLGPGPYLGWSLVMGPLFLKGWRVSPLNGLALLFSFYITMVVCLIGIIVLFSAAGNIGPKVRRTMTLASAIALGIFGFYSFWSGIKIFI